MKACPCCGAVQHSKGADARSLRTSAGPVRLSRRHLRCPDCRHSGYAVDDEVGLGGYLSRRLLRLACLSAADGSFAQASQHLHEYLALDVCAETLRAYCQKQGQHMAGWQPSSEAVAFAFAQAPGQPEFQMDAGKVNTPAGWRDLKIATFAKRPLAEPAEVADWASRDLPRPAARTMFAALEPIDTSQKRLRPQAARLGITEPSGLHVLGTGRSGSGTPAPVTSRAIPGRWTSTTRRSTWARPARPCMGKGPRRPRAAWSAAANGCCPRAGRAYATSWPKSCRPGRRPSAGRRWRG